MNKKNDTLTTLKRLKCYTYCVKKLDNDYRKKLATTQPS